MTPSLGNLGGFKGISCSQALIIINPWYHLYKSMTFGTLVAWNIQVCVNTTQRGKDISADLREAIVATQQSYKDYKMITKLLAIQLSRMRKTVHKWKTFMAAVNLLRSECRRQIYQGVWPRNAHRNTKKTPKNYISEPKVITQHN